MKALSKVEEAKQGLGRDDITHVKTYRPFPSLPAMQYVRLRDGEWYDYNVGIPIPRGMVKDVDTFNEWLYKEHTVEDKVYTMGKHPIDDEDTLTFLNIGI